MGLLKNILLWIFSFFGGLTMMSLVFFGILSLLIKRLNYKLSKIDKNH